MYNPLDENPKALTPLRLERLIREAPGSCIEDLMEWFEVDKATVKIWLKATCISLNRTLFEARLRPKQVVEDYQEGKSIAELTTKYRISVNIIYRILRSEGVPLRGHSKKKIKEKKTDGIP